MVIDYRLTLREEFLVVNCSPENNAYLPHWDKDVKVAKVNRRELLPHKWEDTTRKCMIVACTLGWEMGDELHRSFWEVASDVPTSTAHPALHKYLM